MIKVDRSFVSNIDTNKESIAIVRAVTTLANALSVPVLVEGIESEATHAVVLELGCQVGQGWYFGKPMPAEAALQLIKQASRDQASPRAVSQAGHRTSQVG
jgi:EAL domain-containing protein (putative c-di-GMP-specific phosphodiesterase class I)